MCAGVSTYHEPKSENIYCTMTVNSFINLPITIRERIYDDLLTFPTTLSTAKGQAPSSTLCNFLFINRQIHAEVIDFIRSQLPVLIKTNDPEFVEKILSERGGLPIVSQLRSEDGSISRLMATPLVSMEIEMSMYHNHLEVTSFAAFLLPARSMKELLDFLWLPNWSIWAMQASVSFDLINTFSHTQEAALAKLVQPWINWFIPSHFVGVSTAPTLPSDLSSQLKKTLLGEYRAFDHLQKVQSLSHSAVTRAQTGDWTGAAERYRMVDRYVRLVWDCHLERMRNESMCGTGTNFVRHLWLMSLDVVANHVQCLINAALGLGASVKRLDLQTNSGNKKKLQEALAVAETGIDFLRQLWTRNTDLIDMAGNNRCGKAKAKLSFRAHLACTGLGDVNAAIGYLEEAKRYEPESAGSLNAKIDALRDEGGEAPEGDGRKEVVLWESH
jgi:hypothetical protein